MRSLREKKSWVNDYENAKVLCEDLEVFYEFYKEDELKYHGNFGQLGKVTRGSKGKRDSIT